MSDIAPKTRERVLRAARELGYRRNALARAVKTGRSRTLGFLAGAVNLDYTMQAFWGLLDEADTQEYIVQHFQLHDRPEDQVVVERCSEHRLDGIIVNDTGHARIVHIIRNEFEARGVPVIWLDPKGPQNWGVQVRPDDESGAAEAIRYLVEVGHRRIALLGGIEGVGTSIPRLRGFQRGMAEAGLNNDLVRWTQWQTPLVETSLDDLLAQSAPPTAILCCSDPTALVVMRRLRRQGYHVPEDISVIGFGDIARVELCDPALSTVHVPYRDMGVEAMKEMLQLIENPSKSQEHRETVFPTTLILRESSGPAPSS